MERSAFAHSANVQTNSIQRASLAPSKPARLETFTKWVINIKIFVKAKNILRMQCQTDNVVSYQKGKAGFNFCFLFYLL